MLTLALAWTAVLAASVAAALFGQTARTGLRPVRVRPRRPPARRRLGLALSMSGPWLALLVGAGAGVATGAWLATAAATLCGVVVVSLTGLALVPR